MPAVDTSSPSAPPTYNTQAILIGLGLGVGALCVCGVIYKSACLLLDWMDSKIEARNDLESQMYKTRPPTVYLQRPESALLSYQWMDDVGPLRPIVPPYLSFLPPPPPVYTGHLSYYPPVDTVVTALPCTATALPFGTSSSLAYLVDIDEKVEVLPLASPKIGSEDTSVVIEEQSFDLPEKTFENQQTLENSDSGAELVAILARLEELESGRVPFAPLLKDSSNILESIINMEPIAEKELVEEKEFVEETKVAHSAEKIVATPLMKPTATKLKRTRAISLKTPLCPLANKSNKENVRRSPSYMSPTAASRGRAGESGATPSKRRAF